MEQLRKIKLELANSYDLPEDELKNLYLYLALAQYRYLRCPNYNEKQLLKQLCIDIKKFSIELQSLIDQRPDSHILHRMYSFFNTHHSHLRRLLTPEEQPMAVE